MKNILIIFVFILFSVGCTSIKKHNSKLDQTISVPKLKKDVDFAYLKLKKLHPDLYWYVSKEQLDYKFDSLKTTITKPITSHEFFTKITPVINEVRQGHLSIFPNAKMWSKGETKELSKKGMGPFSQFDFIMFGDKLYVKKNKSIFFLVIQTFFIESLNLN